MDVHENVILDLLPGVRSGRASAESRQLVEHYLATHPQLATLAAMMPAPEPGLELRALERTRHELGRASWIKGLAIFLTLLPLSFIVDDQGPRLLFSGQPVLMAGVFAAGIALWVHYAMSRRRSRVLD